jgi:uncharacterized protein YqgV (UPF0045/DUF77 family)
MILSAEITMYPLQEDYIPAIDKIIAKLNSYDGLEVQTLPTATILMGDYDLVMDAIKDALRWSVEECGKAVFITKFLLNYEALERVS